MAMLSSHSKPDGRLKSKAIRYTVPVNESSLRVLRNTCWVNFGLTPATGKYRATSHRYKLSIIGSSLVTSSSLKIDACCLWGRFAEQVLNSYHVGEENTIVCLVTNAFEASSVIINPTGSDVNEFLRQLPKNELALTTGNVEVVKPKGIKRQKDTWCIYPERSIVDIIMATEVNDTGETKVMLLDTIAEPIVGVSADELLNGSLEEISLLSNENEDGTCSASTPLSKRSGDNQIDDLASTTKKHCSKAIKMEKKIKVEKIEGE
ncbi:hypothetical protein HID58_086434 [Brassica napus]|uniref:DUF223 domain-containing protein n=1 Tax=Brassica napus TaxID=3708 RepID=A0ABQ7XQF6_BRANA|nr:hypothetical protein HID58_086434 [Brassica napus]